MVCLLCSRSVSMQPILVALQEYEYLLSEVNRCVQEKKKERKEKKGSGVRR